MMSYKFHGPKISDCALDSIQSDRRAPATQSLAVLHAAGDGCVHTHSHATHKTAIIDCRLDKGLAAERRLLRRVTLSRPVNRRFRIEARNVRHYFFLLRVQDEPNASLARTFLIVRLGWAAQTLPPPAPLLHSSWQNLLQPSIPDPGHQERQAAIQP